jgi:hypothetical protein
MRCQSKMRPPPALLVCPQIPRSHQFLVSLLVEFLVRTRSLGVTHGALKSDGRSTLDSALNAAHKHAAGSSQADNRCHALRTPPAGHAIHNKDP